MFKSEKGTFLFSVFLQNCFLFFCIPIFHFLALSISAYNQILKDGLEMVFVLDKYDIFATFYGEIQ